MKKISLIGAGSGCFSTKLIGGICNSKVLSGCLVSLMDINEERLDAVYTLCVRLNELRGGSIRFEKTTDRAASLTGADFVINTALAAPHDRLQTGFDIAKKWGFRFGGSYHVMYDEAFWINFYQFRLMEAVTRDMEKYCPDAWHLMVANPVVAGVTLLQRKYPKVKMVGLCHGYEHVYLVAQTLGYQREDLTYQIPGVNHFVWLNEASLKGEPLFPILDRWLDEHPETLREGSYAPLGKKKIDFYRKHGVLPIGDTMGWTGASWPWWYHSDDETEKEYVGYSPQKGWSSYFSSVKENAAKLIEVSKGPQSGMDEFLSSISDEVFIVKLVESMAGDAQRVMIVNVLNRGQLVPGLPEDFEVEVPALCDADGVHPIRTSPLPKHVIAHILRDRVAPVEMELAAYEEGRLDFLRELILMDKWATSFKQADGFLGEILSLPYHEEMREHYR